jgi:3-oxoadipate enol-lactonase
MAVARSGDAWVSWRSEGEGEPVLMIMGLAGSSRAWFRLLPHVAREYRAIVFDHRGTGDSDAVTRPLRMRDLVADTLAVLDAAEIDRAHVIGVSMGGMIAQHLALDHRERVRSLILGCTTPGGGGTPPWRLLAGTALRPLLGPRRTFPMLAPVLYAERTRREQPDRVRADFEMRLADGTPVRTSYAQMAAIAGHDTRERLRELAGLPVTVLHGAEDALVPARAGRALAEAIPGARLVEFPDCGHILTTDAEDAVAAAVLHHLKTCAERSPQPA